jgi:hypothetical protein
MLGEVYKVRSSSLWNSFHAPATAFAWGPNILVNSLLSNILSLSDISGFRGSEYEDGCLPGCWNV